MRIDSRFSRMAGMLVVLLTLLAVPAGITAAQEDTGNSSITVHNRICPQDYDGQDYFQDCHDNVPDPGLPFTFSDGVTRDGTTNDEGNVGFANLPAGTYTITGGVPGEFADTYVYCAVGTEATPNQEQIDVEYVTGGIQIDLPENTNVICDWYNIPENLQGPTPVPTEAPTQEPTEGPATNSSVTIHDRICPPGYEGQDFFDDCHGTLADPGVPFTIGDGVTQNGTTNEDGNVGFANLPADTYAITGGTGGFADLSVSCAIGTEAESNQEQIDVTYVTGGIQIDLPADTNVICDWYNIPAAGPATVAPTETPPTATATMPAEPGRTLQIRTGTCEPGQIGSSVVDLTDLRAPEPEDTGTGATANVVIAETSSSTVPMSLDELRDGTYIVVAYSEDDTSDPVACTGIAGPLNEDGELVIGLQEMDDSGYAGIVYLVQGSNANETNISVFLAEGLSHERAPATPAA